MNLLWRSICTVLLFYCAVLQPSHAATSRPSTQPTFRLSINQHTLSKPIILYSTTAAHWSNFKVTILLWKDGLFLYEKQNKGKHQIFAKKASPSLMQSFLRAFELFMGGQYQGYQGSSCSDAGTAMMHFFLKKKKLGMIELCGWFDSRKAKASTPIKTMLVQIERWSKEFKDSKRKQSRPGLVRLGLKRLLVQKQHIFYYTGLRLSAVSKQTALLTVSLLRRMLRDNRRDKEYWHWAVVRLGTLATQGIQQSTRKKISHLLLQLRQRFQDPVTRALVLDALGKFPKHSKRAYRLLLKSSIRGTAWERVLAVEALGKTRRCSSATRKTLARAGKDSSYRVRAEAIRSWKKINCKFSRALLLSWLKDSVWCVRFQALELLKFPSALTLLELQKVLKYASKHSGKKPEVCWIKRHNASDSSLIQVVSGEALLSGYLHYRTTSGDVIPNALEPGASTEQSFRRSLLGYINKMKKAATLDRTKKK